MQLHPDVNKDADANEKFMSVRLAYEVRSGYYEVLLEHANLYFLSLNESVRSIILLSL